MSKKVLNIPRIYAENFKSELEPSEWAWISISEPGDDPYYGRFIQNGYLDILPNLKLKFHDLEEPAKYNNEILEPLQIEDAEKILKFIFDNSDKNLIVNCAAGISRSGAICKFCEDCLGYVWHEEYKKLANPNMHIYNLLKSLYKRNEKSI